MESPRPSEDATEALNTGSQLAPVTRICDRFVMVYLSVDVAYLLILYLLLQQGSSPRLGKQEVVETLHASDALGPPLGGRGRCGG